ncbi:MAG TPA: efflux RND transporter periplasmic adaptor subunit [Acidobacteriaceae bacterium]|nr:efflux RND transporter periplasmic adaptor subunit [Acidobacteriaceae bacterium]
MKKLLPSYLFLLALLPLSAGLIACSSNSNAPTAVPQTVQDVTLMQVHAEQVPDIFQVTGTVQAAETAQIAPQMMGTIMAVNVTEGSPVHAGQTLARIDAAQPQAGLEQAQASAAAARHEVTAAQSGQALAASTLQRYELLHERKSVSAQEYDEVRQQLQAANARLEVAKASEAQAHASVAQAATAVYYTNVRAPFSGIVTKRLVDPGALASPGVPIFTLESTGRYRLEVSVDEQNISSIHVGERVAVQMDALGEKEISGKILQVYPAADTESHSFTVKVELPWNPALRSGLFGRADFVRGQKNSIVIPQTAVQRQGNLSSVYVVGVDRIAQLRYITLGREWADRAEVLSGLSAEETIVTSPDGRELGGKLIVNKQTTGQPVAVQP